MENKITNLKKDKTARGGNLWVFEYDGVKTIIAEVGFAESRNVFLFDIIMHRPDGRYSIAMEVLGELLTEHENAVLNWAALQCLKAYEKRAKQQND
ncbi:MAG: hypothetical protein IPJ02_17575 [Chitinophagaceae bacterium]|nr:hypothetical protein [Chitinophagaceae bacterium]